MQYGKKELVLPMNLGDGDVLNGFELGYQDVTSNRQWAHTYMEGLDKSREG